MKTEEQRKFIAANIDLLYSYKVNELYLHLWLEKFKQSYDVNTERALGGPESGGHLVPGLGQTYVFPDKETVEAAVARVDDIRSEHFEDVASHKLYCQLQPVSYQFQKIEVGPKFTMQRTIHGSLDIHMILQYVATGQLPTDLVAVNEFKESVGGDRYSGLSSFKGTFCGIELNGFKNGRLDVSGLNSDQQGRLAFVVTLANKVIR